MLQVWSAPLETRLGRVRSPGATRPRCVEKRNGLDAAGPRTTANRRGRHDILISHKTPNRHAAPTPPHQTAGQALPPLAVCLVAIGVVHGDGLRAGAHKGVLASAAGGRVEEGPRRHLDHGARGVVVCSVCWRRDSSACPGKDYREVGARTGAVRWAIAMGPRAGRWLPARGRPTWRRGLEGSRVGSSGDGRWRCGTVSMRGQGAARGRRGRARINAGRRGSERCALAREGRGLGVVARTRVWVIIRRLEGWPERVLSLGVPGNSLRCAITMPGVVEH